MKQTARVRLILLMPILLALPALFIPRMMNNFQFQLTTLAMLMATIPYGIFVIAALIGSRNRLEAEVRKASWLIPPVFALLYFVVSLNKSIRVDEQCRFRNHVDIGPVIERNRLWIFCVFICVTVSLGFKFPASIRQWFGHKS